MSVLGGVELDPASHSPLTAMSVISFRVLYSSEEYRPIIL